MADLVYQARSKEDREVLINQGYIHYYYNDVDWGFITAKIKDGTERALKDAENNMDMRYRQALQAQGIQIFKKSSDGTTQALDYVTNFNDSDLNELFNACTKAMNEQVRQTFEDGKDGFNVKYQNAYKYKNLFAKGDASKDEISEFLDYIGETLNLIGVMKGKKKAWNSFCLAYQGIMSNSVSQLKNSPQVVRTAIAELEGSLTTLQVPDEMRKVMEYLVNIGTTIYGKKGKGIYSSQSMSSTLGNIFALAMGEKTIAGRNKIVTKTLKEMEAWLNIPKSEFGNGVHIYQGHNETPGNKTAIGTLEDRKSTVKTDVIKGGGITFSVEGQDSGDEYAIVGNLTSSVKWYQSLKRTDELADDLKIHSTTAYVQLAEQVFGTENRYGIYNTLAWHDTALTKRDRTAKEQNFRMIRSAVIAKYLDQFIAGSGGALFSDKNGAKDTVLFLVVNGKYYSIYSILLKYLEEVKTKENMLTYGSTGRGGSEKGLITMGFSYNNSRNKGDKTWQWIDVADGDKRPSRELAQERSLKAQEAIRKFNISIKINKKSLAALTL